MAANDDVDYTATEQPATVVETKEITRSGSSDSLHETQEVPATPTTEYEVYNPALWHSYLEMFPPK